MCASCPGLWHKGHRGMPEVSTCSATARGQCRMERAKKEWSLAYVAPAHCRDKLPPNLITGGMDNRQYHGRVRSLTLSSKNVACLSAKPTDHLPRVLNPKIKADGHEDAKSHKRDGDGQRWKSRFWSNTSRSNPQSYFLLTGLSIFHGRDSLTHTESQNGRGWKGPLGII